MRAPVYQLREVDEGYVFFMAALDIKDVLEDDGTLLDVGTGQRLYSPRAISEQLIMTGITWATRGLVAKAQKLARER